VLLKHKATERRSEGDMENAMVVKQRLLLIAAALVLALAVSSSVANTAHARVQTYDSTKYVWDGFPETGHLLPGIVG